MSKLLNCEKLTKFLRQADMPGDFSLRNLERDLGWREKTSQDLENLDVENSRWNYEVREELKLKHGLDFVSKIFGKAAFGYRNLPRNLTIDAADHEIYLLNVETGEIVSEHPFSCASDFYDGVAWVVRRNEAFLIDQTGKKISQFYLSYTDMGKKPFGSSRGEYKGQPIVFHNPHYGVLWVKSNGDVIHPKLDMEAVRKRKDHHSKYMIYNDNYTGGSSFSDGVAWLYEDDKKSCLIDEKGEILFSLPPGYEMESNYRDGYALISRKVNTTAKSDIYYEFSSIDKQGNIKDIGVKIDVNKTMLPSVQSDFSAQRYSEGWYIGNYFGDEPFYFNIKGRIVKKEMGGYPNAFREGFAIIKDKSDDLDYFIDQNGEHFNSERYFWAKPFSEGYAAVQPKKDGTWRYIDKTGKKVEKLGEFRDARSFKNGQAIVDTGTGYFLIDKDGKNVLGVLGFQTIIGPQDGIYSAREDDGTYFYFGRDGRLLSAEGYSLE